MAEPRELLRPREAFPGMTVNASLDSVGKSSPQDKDGNEAGIKALTC